MDLRDNISERRRAAGLTQEDVASKLGVSRQTVGKWESGRATPELEKLIALSDLLGCSLDELVGRAEENVGNLGEIKTSVKELEVSGSEKSAVEDLHGWQDGMQHPHRVATAKYAALLAAGIWFVAAAIGLTALLFGPSSVDNIEVRGVVPYAVLLGIVFGAALVVAARMYRARNVQIGTTDEVSARRWGTAAAMALAMIACGICALIAFAPNARATMLICLEVLALAAWPATFAVVFAIDSRR